MNLNRKALLLVLSFYLLLNVNAQEIHFSIEGMLVEKVYLQIYHGDDLSIVDSAIVINDEFHFNNGSYKTGLYKLVLGDMRDAELFNIEVPTLEFIGSQEDMSFQTSYFAPQENMNVLQSVENEIFYKYLSLNSDYRESLGSLLNVLPKYTSQDKFYPFLSMEMVRLQRDYNDKLLLMASGESDSFISAYLKFMIEPVYDPSSGLGIKEFMRDNFFDPIDFNSPVLINSPAIPQKILAFLSFYANSDYSQEEQEQAFILAVDALMDELKYSAECHGFVLNFLIDGFQRFQMETVLVHIADNHLSEECETDNEKIMQERLLGYQAMAPGKVVKNISLLNEFDQAVSLSDSQNEYRLIVFWASWCHHCTKLLPQLHKWYLKEGENYDLEVYAVSIDSSKANWEEFVFLNDLKWINVLERKGWDGKVAQQYNLYATPTMFLINRKREILSKPLSLRELNKYFKEN